jgi:hypothetical protein
MGETENSLFDSRLLHSVQTGCGVRPAAFGGVTRGSSPLGGVKRLGCEDDISLLQSVEVKPG